MIDYYRSVKDGITKSTKHSGYTIYIPESAKNKKMSDNTIKLKHPQFGLVTFSGMTLRQMDVLRDYEKLKIKNESNKQNKINIKSKT